MMMEKQQFALEAVFQPWVGSGEGTASSLQSQFIPGRSLGLRFSGKLQRFASVSILLLSGGLPTPCEPAHAVFPFLWK